MQNFKEALKNYIKAGYPALWVTTHEETRAQRDILTVAKEFESGKKKAYDVGLWSITQGYSVLKGNKAETVNQELQDPNGLIQYLLGQLNDDSGMERTIVVLRDFHKVKPDNDPTLNRGIRDLIPAAKKRQVVLVFLSPVTQIPQEWEKIVHPLPYRLPDRDALGVILAGILKSAAAAGGKDIDLDENARDKAIEAALGMCADEAESAFALSLIETRAITPAVIHREKAATLAKGGLVEVVDANTPITQVGGLENVKAYLDDNKKGFGKEAKQFGIPIPAGFLLIGCPGTGKSMVAKATANYLGLPLLQVNLGALKGGIVGETEAKTAQAIDILKACAPCVAFIDEVEKGFAGAGGRAIDGGASEGQFGQFLTFLNDRVVDQIPVFCICTANNVRLLPPEFQRAGRFDAVFGVDLPTSAERKEIFKIHIAKQRTAGAPKRKPDEYNLAKLVAVTHEYTGAEIEQIIVRALKSAFRDSKELSTDYLLKAAESVKPLSKTRPDEIRAIRKFLRDGGGEPASAPEQDKTLATSRALDIDWGDEDDKKSDPKDRKAEK